MNVKTGDMAIVVGAPSNNGAIGTVGRFIGTMQFQETGTEVHDLWEVHFDRPVKTVTLSTRQVGASHKPFVRDAVLRKIAGPDVLLDELRDKEIEHV